MRSAMSLLAIVVGACSPVAAPSSATTTVIGTPVSLGAPIAAHQAGFIALAATPNGMRVVTADRPPEASLHEVGGAPGVTVWDVASWQALAQLGTHRARAVAIAPGGDTVVAADDDGYVRVWRVADHALVRELALPSPRAVWTDGARVIAVGGDGRVQEWNASGSAARSRAGEGTIQSAVISPTGDRIARVRESGIDLVGLGSDRSARLAIKDAHAIAFTPEGASVAVSSLDGDVLADASTGAIVGRLAGVPGWPARAFAPLSPTRVAIATNDGLLDTTARGPRDLETFDMLALVRGTSVIGATAAGVLREVDLDRPDAHPRDAHAARIELVASGRDFVVSRARDGARLWALKTRASQPLVEPGRALVAVSPDASRAAWFEMAEGGPARVRITAIAGSAAPVEVELTSSSGASHAAFSADLGTLVMAGQAGEGDAIVTRADLRTRHVATFPAGDEVVQAIAVSRDGALAAVATGKGEIAIYRADGTRVTTLAHNVNNTSVLAFTPDAKMFVTTTESNGIQVWDLASGAARTLYKGDGRGPQGSSDPAYAGALTSNGAVLVTGHGSGIVRVWRLSDGAELAHAQSSPSMILALAIAPDDADVVVGDAAGSLAVISLHVAR